MKRLPSVCVPFLPLPRLTGAPRSCLGLRRGFWFLLRWDSGLGARAEDRGTRPGILPGVLGLLFFGGTPRQGLVGGGEAIGRDTEVRDELDEELVSFGGDGTADGGAAGDASGGPCDLCPGLTVPASLLRRTYSPLHPRTRFARLPTSSAHQCGGSRVQIPPLQLSPAPPNRLEVPTTVSPGELETPRPTVHPGPAPSPRGGVAAELPQPLGVVAHGSVEYADRVVAAVGVGLQVKLPEGQRDYLAAGPRAA